MKAISPGVFAFLDRFAINQLVLDQSDEVDAAPRTGTRTRMVGSRIEYEHEYEDEDEDEDEFIEDQHEGEEEDEKEFESLGEVNNLLKLTLAITTTLIATDQRGELVADRLALSHPLDFSVRRLSDIHATRTSTRSRNS